MREKRIKEICELRLGHSFRKRLVCVPEGTTKVIHPSDIAEDGILRLNSEEEFYTDVIPRNPLKTNEVLFLNKGRFAAAVFRMPDDECWVVPSSVIVLTVITKDIIPEYLALYLNSSKGQKQIERLKEVSSIPFVTRHNLMELRVPIPELPKQHNLVDLNTTIHQFREKLTRKSEILVNILNSELE